MIIALDFSRFALICGRDARCPGKALTAEMKLELLERAQLS